MFAFTRFYKVHLHNQFSSISSQTSYKFQQNKCLCLSRKQYFAPTLENWFKLTNQVCFSSKSLKKNLKKHSTFSFRDHYRWFCLNVFYNFILRYLAHPQMKYFQYNRLSTWWHCIYMRKLRHSVNIAETLLPRVWCWYGTCDTRTRARIHTLIILFFPFMKVQKTGESNFMKPSKFEDDSVAQNN